MTKVIKMMQGKTLYRKRINSKGLDTLSYPYQNRILGQQTFRIKLSKTLLSAKTDRISHQPMLMKRI